jgi:hypothetical protein
MTKMNYERHGRPPYGRNRELVAQDTGPRGEPILRVTLSDGRLVGRFTTWAEARRAQHQAASESGQEVIIRREL